MFAPIAFNAVIGFIGSKLPRWRVSSFFHCVTDRYLHPCSQMLFPPWSLESYLDREPACYQGVLWLGTCTRCSLLYCCLLYVYQTEIESYSFVRISQGLLILNVFDNFSQLKIVNLLFVWILKENTVEKMFGIASHGLDYPFFKRTVLLHLLFIDQYKRLNICWYIIDKTFFNTIEDRLIFD